ncbi:MAG: hypothetical protein ACKVOE_01365 [Rickettsiales bacterium]
MHSDPIEPQDWRQLSDPVLQEYAVREAQLRAQHKAGLLPGPMVMPNGYVVDGVDFASYAGAAKELARRHRRNGTLPLVMPRLKKPLLDGDIFKNGELNSPTYYKLTNQDVERIRTRLRDVTLPLLEQAVANRIHQLITQQEKYTQADGTIPQSVQQATETLLAEYRPMLERIRLCQALNKKEVRKYVSHFGYDVGGNIAAVLSVNKPFTLAKTLAAVREKLPDIQKEILYQLVPWSRNGFEGPSPTPHLQAFFKQDFQQVVAAMMQPVLDELTEAYLAIEQKKQHAARKASGEHLVPIDLEFQQALRSGRKAMLHEARKLAREVTEGATEFEIELLADTYRASKDAAFAWAEKERVRRQSPSTTIQLPVAQPEYSVGQQLRQTMSPGFVKAQQTQMQQRWGGVKMDRRDPPQAALSPVSMQALSIAIDAHLPLALAAHGFPLACAQAVSFEFVADLLADVRGLERVKSSYGCPYHATLTIDKPRFEAAMQQAGFSDDKKIALRRDLLKTIAMIAKEATHSLTDRRGGCMNVKGYSADYLFASGHGDKKRNGDGRDRGSHFRHLQKCYDENADGKMTITMIGGWYCRISNPFEVAETFNRFFHQAGLDGVNLAPLRREEKARQQAMATPEDIQRHFMHLPSCYDNANQLTTRLLAKPYGYLDTNQRYNTISREITQGVGNLFQQGTRASRASLAAPPKQQQLPAR